MDKYRYELMRELQHEYYGERERDPFKDLKYLAIRIGLVGLLLVTVLVIWPL